MTSTPSYQLRLFTISSVPAFTPGASATLIALSHTFFDEQDQTTDGNENNGSGWAHDSVIVVQARTQETLCMSQRMTEASQRSFSWRSCIQLDHTAVTSPTSRNASNRTHGRTRQHHKPSCTYSSQRLVDPFHVLIKYTL
jgi:hypothetical protein